MHLYSQLIIKRLAVHYFINLTFQLRQLCVLTRNPHRINEFWEYCATFSPELQVFTGYLRCGNNSNSLMKSKVWNFCYGEANEISLDKGSSKFGKWYWITVGNLMAWLNMISYTYTDEYIYIYVYLTYACTRNTFQEVLETCTKVYNQFK